MAVHGTASRHFAGAYLQTDVVHFSHCLRIDYDLEELRWIFIVKYPATDPFTHDVSSSIFRGEDACYNKAEYALLSIWSK